MRNIKLTIEYDGTHFNGWQIQSPQTRTVQGVIERVLEKIFKKKTRIIGSGRTDSGVHALGQVAHFKTTSKMTPTEMQRAMNTYLPQDIVILEVKDVPLTFHAQYSIKRKIYRYRILTRTIPKALHRYDCLHYPFPLNVRAMRREAKLLHGKHDFRSFAASDPAALKARKEKNTVRTIYRIDIRRKKDEVLIECEANGFLYKMVRNIVGTLLDIGTGKLPPGSVTKIISKKDRNYASDTAAACGLCLMQAVY